MKKKPFILFLTIFITILSAGLLSASDWIDTCIEHTIHSRFDKALEVVNQQLVLDAENYQAYFYLAATLSSKMTHFENNDNEQIFMAALDSAISIIEPMIEDTTEIDPQILADYLFYLGSAYGYLAFYQGRTGSYFPALTNGLKSNSLLNLAVATDSTLYDAYLGIGVFKYWRYSKLKIISWLPFIPDERDEGIEYIKETIIHGTRSQYMAMHQLAYILSDYGSPEEAIPYAEQIVEKYPESQFMWWAAAKCYDKSDDFENAIHAYEQLSSLLSTDPNANPNHIYKCKLKLVEIYQRMENYQLCQKACADLLIQLANLSISDRDDKIEEINDILSECKEQQQELSQQKN